MLAFKRGRECNGCLVVNGIWRSWGIYVWCWTMMMMWSYYGDMMLEPTTNGFVGSDPWTFTFKTLAILSQCMVSMQFHYSELKLTRPAIFCENIFFEHSGTDVILSRLMSSRFQFISKLACFIIPIRANGEEQYTLPSDKNRNPELGIFQTLGLKIPWHWAQNRPIVFRWIHNILFIAAPGAVGISQSSICSIFLAFCLFDTCSGGLGRLASMNFYLCSDVIRIHSRPRLMED